jgi:hypothetical protein
MEQQSRTKANALHLHHKILKYDWCFHFEVQNQIEFQENQSSLKISGVYSNVASALQSHKKM